MSDLSDITEFASLDCEELHLVGSAANRFTALMAKSSVEDRLRKTLADLDAVDPTKGRSKVSKKSKLDKALRKALDIDLSGGTSTAAQRMSATALNDLVRGANRHTNANLADQAEAIATSARTAKSVIAAYDERVTKCQVAIAAARDEFERSRAAADLTTALKARAMAKLVLADNARARGHAAPGRFGPNSTDLFSGTSLTLPEDREMKYL